MNPEKFGKKTEYEAPQTPDLIIFTCFNAASCSFTLAVKDVSAPQLSCPTGVVLITPDPLTCVGDAPTAWPNVSAADCNGPVRVSSAPPAGARGIVDPSRPVVAVTVVATDAGGNTATCEFAAALADSIACPRLP